MTAVKRTSPDRIGLNSTGGIVSEANAEVIHMWNNKDDYFFNYTSGIQFTNHFQEYWTHNIFCGGYKNSSNDWVYDCLDELPFNWNIKTDNLTYVNYTGWRDKTVGSNTVRIGIRYNLNINDTNLSVQLSVENIGASDITNDLGFAWRVKDINISGDNSPDRIYINNTIYWLDEELDLRFTNLNDASYVLRDKNAYIRLNWGSGLNYFVEVKSTPNQHNAPVTLEINAGPLAIGQQKSTTIYWKDPVQLFFEDCNDMTIQWTQPINSWTSSSGQCLLHLYCPPPISPKREHQARVQHRLPPCLLLGAAVLHAPPSIILVSLQREKRYESFSFAKSYPKLQC